MRRAWLSLLVAVTFPMTALAAPVADDNPIASGNVFLRTCDPAQTTSSVGLGVCLGYVQGIIARDEVAPSPGRRICLPRRVTYGQALDTVMAYMRASPQTRHYDSFILIITALHAAFPCPSS